MSLLIRQKIFTLTDTYEVRDDAGRPRYAVSTEFLTLGHHIHIVDLETGREEASIDERLLTFLQKADITVRGSSILMRREFTFFVPRYSLSNGWSVDGDFLGLEYDIKNSLGDAVARVSKRLLSLSDTYELYTYERSNELAAMAVAITIDMMNCRN